jgi:hypothetical protein
MTTSEAATTLPTSSKVLCAVYGAVDTVLLAVFAVVAAGLTIWVDMG